MVYYMVGGVVDVGFNIRNLSLSKENLEQNLRNLQNPRIFTSLQDAQMYASILMRSEGNQTFHAPVIHIEPRNNRVQHSLSNVEVQTESLNGDNDKATTINFIPSDNVPEYNVADFWIKAYEFPSTGYQTQYFTQALPFFRALNPTSDKSGIDYALARNLALDSDYPAQGHEMLDYTVSEVIKREYNGKLDFINGMVSTFHIIVGGHYDIPLKGAIGCWGGSKGILDYLILPLIARKLIADTYLSERQTTHLFNTLAWAAALPIEILRFSAGIALTLILIPIVALTTFARSFECNNEDEADTTFSPAVL
ncbi:MAG: hypothetical protein H0U73_09255 [Tatlockia sp.]|nr:hypothetical protein [Tatlockia sp.]